MEESMGISGIGVKRLLWSVVASLSLFVLVFAAAWFLDESLVWPILPGNLLVELARKTTHVQPGVFYQVVFLLGNVLFWTVVFYSSIAAIALIRRNRRG